MKRVRTQETSGNYSPCITRSKKKRDERDENDSFYIIPLDLKTELLLKLPPKSIARLTFVSKHWSPIIFSKDFIELFLSRSTTRPQFLFTFRKHGMHFLHSCSEEDPSSDHHTVSLSDRPYDWYKFSAPVRGLICFQDDTKVVICNPSTGQFLTLPRVKTWRRGISTFFGYDPISDVYKVLCVTVRQHRPRYHIGAVVSEEHQVFTLGGAQKRWRMIKCKHPHRPCLETKGICKDGVVYYLALIDNKKSIISFDLRTEDLNVIELPEAYVPGDFDLVNYNGKIAFGNQTNIVTVLEDISKQEWLKVSTLFIGFVFRGTTSTGELIFAPSSASSNPYTLLCYDLKKKIVRKIVIEGLGHDSSNVKLFLGHIESPMFLSKKLIR